MKIKLNLKTISDTKITLFQTFLYVLLKYQLHLRCNYSWIWKAAQIIRSCGSLMRIWDYLRHCRAPVTQCHACASYPNSIQWIWNVKKCLYKYIFQPSIGIRQEYQIPQGALQKDTLPTHTTAAALFKGAVHPIMKIPSGAPREIF